MTGWSMGIEGWLWMGAWMLVLVIVVALLVRTPRRHANGEAPLDILRSRLARGEISPDEYERAKGLLEESTKEIRPIGPTSDRKANR
jgi:putative membrane protein